MNVPSAPHLCLVDFDLAHLPDLEAVIRIFTRCRCASTRPPRTLSGRTRAASARARCRAPRQARRRLARARAGIAGMFRRVLLYIAESGCYAIYGNWRPAARWLVAEEGRVTPGSSIRGKIERRDPFYHTPACPPTSRYRCGAAGEDRGWYVGVVVQHVRILGIPQKLPPTPIPHATDVNVAVTP